MTLIIALTTKANSTLNNQRTQTRMNKNDNNIYSRFFEERWLKYPVKDGKKEAKRYFLATVKSEQDLKDFDKALDNYLCHLKTESWKRPKNGSTFFNNWKDWIDAGTVKRFDEITH